MKKKYVDVVLSWNMQPLLSFSSQLNPTTPKSPHPSPSFTNHPFLHPNLMASTRSDETTLIDVVMLRLCSTARSDCEGDARGCKSLHNSHLGPLSPSVVLGM